MAKNHEIQHFNIPVDLSYIDKLPYNVHPDTKRQVSLVSGNIIKGYMVHMEEDKRIIDPLDFDPDVIDSYSKDNNHSNVQNENPEDLSNDFENLEGSISNIEPINSDETINDNSKL